MCLGCDHEPFFRLGLDVTSENDHKRGRIYRIESVAEPSIKKGRAFLKLVPCTPRDVFDASIVARLSGCCRPVERNVSPKPVPPLKEMS